MPVPNCNICDYWFHVHTFMSLLGNFRVPREKPIPKSIDEMPKYEEKEKKVNFTFQKFCGPTLKFLFFCKYFWFSIQQESELLMLFKVWNMLLIMNMCQHSHDWQIFHLVQKCEGIIRNWARIMQMSLVGPLSFIHLCFYWLQVSDNIESTVY